SKAVGKGRDRRKGAAAAGRSSGSSGVIRWIRPLTWGSVVGGPPCLGGFWGCVLLCSSPGSPAGWDSARVGVPGRGTRWGDVNQAPGVLVEWASPVGCAVSSLQVLWWGGVRPRIAPCVLFENSTVCL